MPHVSRVRQVIHDTAPTILSSDDWAPALIKEDRAVLSCKLRHDLPHLLEFAHQSIRIGNTQDATNWLAIAFYCDPERTRRQAGRNGVLRCSKFGFNASCLADVITNLLKYSAALLLPPPAVQYLQSVSHLLQLANSVRRADKFLRDFLVRNEDNALKSTIARTEFLFMKGHEANLGESSDSLAFYTKEDLAEGASYIIHCFDSEVGIQRRHFYGLADGSLARGLFDKLLIKACKIRRYCDAEILIDTFDYHCTLRRRSVHIEPAFPNIEKSIRLGFIQVEQIQLRNTIDRIRASKTGQFTSILQAADTFYDRFRDHIVRLVEHPLRRYVFRFPNVPEFRLSFSDEGLAVEEHIYLREILTSELVTWEELERFEVRPGISAMHLIKVRRLFMFLSRLVARHLITVSEQDPRLAYRSLVAVFEFTQLNELLEWSLPKELINSVVEMISWTTGATGLMDIQYRPIISDGNFYLVPLYIAGTINWYRNLAYTQKQRAIETAEEEVASRALAATLGRVSPMVRKGFETSLRGKKIEIDVTCRFGEYLFLFECKHALLPCNLHELRTSYDHVRKAAKQLETIAELLSHRETEAEYYKRLKWNTEPAKEIITCIVSCNGMFPGLSILGHPVRRWAELKNMIEDGTVRIGSAQMEEDDSGTDIKLDNVIEHNLWGTTDVTPEFLREYIAGEWLQKTFFDTMVAWERSYSFDEWKLTFSTFVLDFNAVKGSIEASGRANRR